MVVLIGVLLLTILHAAHYVAADDCRDVNYDSECWEDITSAYKYCVLYESSFEDPDHEGWCKETCGYCPGNSVECQNPGPVANATQMVTNASIAAGQYFEYECLGGYVLESGNLGRTCAGNGTIMGLAPVCKLPGDAACRDTFDICEWVLEEQYYYCNEEYALHEKYGCQYTCGLCPDNTARCLNPGPVANAIEMVTNTSIAAGQYFEYECLDGFVLESGNLGRTCGRNGIVMGSVPVCNFAADHDWVIEEVRVP